MAKGKGLINGLIELLFPPRCAACGALMSPTERETGALCARCMEEWRLAKEMQCEKCFCAATQCRCQPELLEHVSCHAFYKLVYYLHGKETPVQNRIIYRIKNTRDRRAVAFLTQELATALKHEVMDSAVVAYIPRRRIAYLETGTDQARELASSLARELGLPLLHCLKRKKGRDREQKKLGPEERWRNAKSSYALADQSIKGKRVILVDDIVTTGASLAACVQKLLRAGATEVLCVAVAADDANRTPKMAPLIKSGEFAHFQ